MIWESKMRCFLLLFVLVCGAPIKAEEVIPTPVLSDGILALRCTGVSKDDGRWDETIVIIEKDGDHQVVNAPNLDEVSEIKSGYVLKSTKDAQALGFIRRTDEDWSIEFLSERGILQGTCKDEASFVETIISAIAPKLVSNIKANFETELRLNQRDIDQLETELEKNEAVRTELSTALKVLEIAKSNSDRMAQNAGAMMDPLAIAMTTALAPVNTKFTEDLVLTIAKCWNLGASSTASQFVTLIMDVAFSETGKPLSESIELIGHVGGDKKASVVAFEAARRAVLQCGESGYEMPAGYGENFTKVRLIFDPYKIRYKNDNPG